MYVYFGQWTCLSYYRKKMYCTDFEEIRSKTATSIASKLLKTCSGYLWISWSWSRSHLHGHPYSSIIFLKNSPIMLILWKLIFASKVNKLRRLWDPEVFTYHQLWFHSITIVTRDTLPEQIQEEVSGSGVLAPLTQWPQDFMVWAKELVVNGAYCRAE